MKKQLLSLMALLLLILSCSQVRDEKIFDNPLDPKGTTYDPTVYDTVAWFAEPVYQFVFCLDENFTNPTVEKSLTECKYVTTLSNEGANADNLNLRIGKGFSFGNSLPIGDVDIIRVTYRASHATKLGVSGNEGSNFWGYSVETLLPATDENKTVEVTRSDFDSNWGNGSFESTKSLDFQISPENKADQVFIEISSIELLYDEEKEIVSRKPEVVNPPNEARGAVGEEVTFTTDVLGDELHYQWMLDGEKIGSDSSSVNVTLESSYHNKKVSCAVYNYKGIETTNDAAITIVEYDTLNWLNGNGDWDFGLFFQNDKFQFIEPLDVLLDKSMVDVSADSMSAETHAMLLAIHHNGNTPVGAFDKIKISYVSDRDMRVLIDSDTWGVVATTTLAQSDTEKSVTIYPESFTHSWGVQGTEIEKGYKIVFSFETPNAPEDVKLEIKDLKLFYEK